MGYTVYRSPSLNTRVHADPDCPRALGPLKKELQKLDLAEVRAPKLCRTCFPEAPRVGKVWHPLCRECEHDRPRPCPHNGAVLVRVDQRTDYGPVVVENVHMRWVWPEHAHFYTLANPDQVV